MKLTPLGKYHIIIHVYKKNPACKRFLCSIRNLSVGGIVVACCCGILYHIEKSISVIKYHFQGGNGWPLSGLFDNYALYHNSFKDFLLKTSSFHSGCTGAQWFSAVYLLPLFVFCDLFGGLSLKLICFFTVVSSLIFLCLFYWWGRRIFGKQAAFFAVFFLGVSSFFQEIARSGSFTVYSLFITMVCIMSCFLYKRDNSLGYCFFLGILNGLLWYGYSTSRPLSLVFIVFVFLWSNGRYKWKAIGLFLAGMAILIVPGSILLLEQNRHSPQSVHLLFIDKENILDCSCGSFNSILQCIHDNLRIFGQRMMGARQLVEPAIVDKTHAPFYNPILAVPLFIGIGATLMRWRHPAVQLMLFMSLMIYVTPIMTSTIGYVETRRELLYVIPSYCFIGLGMKKIADWIRMIQDRFLKRGMMFLMVFVIIIVLAHEIKFFVQYVLSSKRDVGLLTLVEKIKGIGHGGGDVLY